MSDLDDKRHEFGEDRSKSETYHGMGEDRSGQAGYHAMGEDRSEQDGFRAMGSKALAEKRADKEEASGEWEPAREGSSFKRRRAKKRDDDLDKEEAEGTLDDALQRIERLERKVEGIGSDDSFALQVTHLEDGIRFDPSPSVDDDDGDGNLSSMFYPSTSAANEISVTSGVCVVGLTSYDISALSDEEVLDGEWLILKVDMRDPAVTPVYEVVSDPYPIVTETYFKYIKIARFNDDGDFQRAHNGGLLEVDYT